MCATRLVFGKCTHTRTHGHTHTRTHTANDLCDGNVTVQKTQMMSSTTAIGQAHEQNNAAVKGDGVVVGPNKNPDFLRRWTVAGPELIRTKPTSRHITRNMQKCAIDICSKRQPSGQSKGMHGLFVMGSAFTEDINDFFKRDTKDIAGQVMVVPAQHFCDRTTTGHEIYYRSNRKEYAPTFQSASCKDTVDPSTKF